MTGSYLEYPTQDEGRNTLPTFLSDLGRRMQASCTLLGLDESVHATGKSEKQLKRYFIGASEPPVGVLVRLAEAAGITMAWLASGTIETSADARAALVSLEAELRDLTKAPVDDPDLGERIAIVEQQIQLTSRHLELLENLSAGDGEAAVASQPVEGENPLPHGDVQPIAAFNLDALRAAMPLDMPVYGTAAGSLALHHEGAFELESRVVEYVRRPPALTNIPEAYGFYVAGGSMIPQHRPGDLRFAHPGLTPRRGDTVVVQARYAESLGVEAFIAHFQRRNDEYVFVSKLNPETEIRFEARYVVAIHRVLDLNELFGI
ncbi:MAG TPA: S24 family peptidase [Aurantimonas sp.]|jgi:phage repressor protein C with HTH and peptisase S24 domain/transcriptional regulator with XRE-family HTH domain|nr:S24 family peptidase [Aurantimonas sp.]